MPTHKKTPTVKELEYNDPQFLADKFGISIIWTDHQATRRQRLHGVNIPGGKTAYSSTHINECLNHLALNGYSDAILVCETPRRKHLACYIECFELE